MKRMVHPQHGWHHPMNSGDREDMLKNGWVDEPETVPEFANPGESFTIEGVERAGVPAGTPLNAPVETPKRRGRPPFVAQTTNALEPDVRDALHVPMSVSEGRDEGAPKRRGRPPKAR